MVLTGHQQEAGRCEEHLCPFLRHDTIEFRETHVIADGESELTQFGIDNDDLIARFFVVSFVERACAFYINVEAMNLDIFGNEFAFWVDQHAGVQRSVILRIRIRFAGAAAVEPDIVLLR